MSLKKTIIAFALVVALALAACITVTVHLTHSHDLNEWQTVEEASCTSHGIAKRECECGYVEYTTTEALAHNMSAWQTVVQTACTSFGLEKRSCACGYVEYNTENAFSHTPVTDEAVAPTCTTAGKTAGSHCGVCGDIIVAQETVLATDHSFDDVTVIDEAHCNHEGTKRYSCTNSGCDEYYDESYAEEALKCDEIYDLASQYTGIFRTYDNHGNAILQASAFVINSDGWIAVTDFELVYASMATFTLGEEVYEVTDILASSDKSHIAVLKVDATGLPAATICEDDPINGEAVYIVGAPDGAAISISGGIISNARRVSEDDKPFIQHDTDMSYGYNGGPLLNRFGEVIGINVGPITSAELNASAWASELELLDYSSPISLMEHGKIAFAPNDRITNWIASNMNATNGDKIAYAVEGSNFYYSIGYNQRDDYNFIEGYREISTGQQIYVCIFLDNNAGTYSYYACIQSGTWMNEVNGFIDASTYDGVSMLEYDTYYGRYWAEAIVMDWYTTVAHDALQWFTYCLDTYFDDNPYYESISIETFGFDADVFDRNEAATFELLNSFIENNPDAFYDAETGEYSIAYDISFSATENAIMTLTYIPATESTPASTVARIGYWQDGGFYIGITLDLNYTDMGNKFTFEYREFNGTEYVLMSDGWGYLDSRTFTSNTKLNFFEFNSYVDMSVPGAVSMYDLEDLRLAECTELIYYMLGNIDSILYYIDPSYAIEGLGFYVCFG
ncbi:MAG: trypsin-like peptidase domain-containing protein [Clostridia bacterium]|nr:trypsin-like peptidase domain-containing protein [Clostridia bacterium]